MLEFCGDEGIILEGGLWMTITREMVGCWVRQHDGGSPKCWEPVVRKTQNGQAGAIPHLKGGE